MRRVLVCLFVLFTVAICACVIAQPTDPVPSLPVSRPVIVRTRVDPPVSAVITSWVLNYTLPVELVDPTVDVQYAAFIDFDPLTGDGIVDGTHLDQFSAPTIPADRIRTLNVAISAPADIDRCHVIEIVVSLPFSANTALSAHSPPDPPGGDTISWFYAPGGDLTGCPQLDAGIEASVIEDAADDSESGPR